MSIAPTTRNNVALYDTTTGQTIGGPLFETTEQAEDFIDWAGERALGRRGSNFYPPPAVLIELQAEWRRERLDAEGDLLDESAR